MNQTGRTFKTSAVIWEAFVCFNDMYVFEIRTKQVNFSDFLRVKRIIIVLSSGLR